MKHEINVILSVDKVVSVNAAYSSKVLYVNGRPTSTIYKTREAKLTEAYIKEQIRNLDIPNNYPWVTKDTLFTLSINIIFRNGYLSKDLDNTFKLAIDGIFRALDINDSHVIRLNAQKSYCPGIKEEKICICLRELTNEKELNLLYEPKPEVVWTDWEFKSDLGLKELGKKKMKDTIYLTDDITKANTKLFIIEPEKITYNTFNKITMKIQDNVQYSSGLVYVAFLGSNEHIEEYKKDLQEFHNVYSGVRYKDVSNVQEIYSWLKGDLK